MDVAWRARYQALEVLKEVRNVWSWHAHQNVLPRLESVDG